MKSAHTRRWSLFCLVQLLLGIELFLSLSSRQQLQIASCPVPLLSAGILFVCLNLCRSCACCHSLHGPWRPVSISPVISRRHCFWGSSTTLSHTLLPPSLLHRSMSVKERDLTSYLGLGGSKSFTLFTFLVMGLCINDHLLQEETSLLRAEWYSDL